MITAALAFAISTYPPEFTSLHNAEREDKRMVDTSDMVNTGADKPATAIIVNPDGTARLIRK